MGLSFSSCNDDGKSSAALITAFTFESEFVTEQPVIDNHTITFKVSDAATDNDLSRLVPTITISDNATIFPKSGVAQDFSSNRKVTYTVVTEDGTINEYTVYVTSVQTVWHFSFDAWTTVKGDFLTNEYTTPEPSNTLATSNPGAAFLKLFGFTDVVAFQTHDAVSGTAIRLTTMDTSEKANGLVPAITPGSVFIGTFSLNVMDRLSSTLIGVPYDKKPVYFRGWYKYTPGETFIDGSNVSGPSDVITLPDTVDECSILAVLYEAEDENGNEVTLTGHDINNSTYRVAVAAIDNGAEQKEYTQFDIPFTYLDGKSYDANKSYKIAIVCSSSKEGDYFRGAGGSTLILDELEIIGE